MLKQREVNSAGAKIREVQGHFFFFLITSILAISHPGALACKSSQELLLQDENLKDSQETPPPKPAKNNYANNSIKA